MGDRDRVDVLANTLQGFLNESECTRAEILGVLESVKLSLYLNWDRDSRNEEDE